MTAIVMPQVGQDIERGTIVKWLKRPGDPVRRGEAVLVVESEKASFDVEAGTDGVLVRQLFVEGEEAKVLEPVGWIGSAEEATGATQATIAPAAPASPPVAAEPTAPPSTTPAADSPVTLASTRPASSPSARRVARESGIPLASVAGTGPGGRIVKRDVVAAAPPSVETDGLAPLPPRTAADEVLPFDRVHRIVADRLSLAARTIPHFFLNRDIDVQDALAWRAAYNARTGCRVSITDLVCRAALRALRAFPRLNAHVADDRVTLEAAINLGIAVSSELGLFVPVVADADRLDLRRFSDEARRLAGTVRDGRYVPAATGTFTVTSLGMLGVGSFQPIINPPECAILAVGEAAPRVVAVGGMIGVRTLMTVTLACDHRAVDGAYGAGFLARLAEELARPDGLAEALP
jgi:pyruvate dehydrogenase E2 component (dihydrolipoamide acetyltransferase)